ncbi:Serine/threonine-protein kinase ppk4 [Holothuria leucospilota]|uniref:Serine/threonine-protein kinase ppk4 n=1 Tax=Holothuria leucospilota TaxID=206669 RepID=A0A9Q0YER4_HOLLE|nr:Serine/threonine-protein kinase ppk4 [Holothuria leucospilota]KAJ8042547.1 Serine/threonine-protein kinase ppk4 [Holothuria leucospilota]
MSRLAWNCPGKRWASHLNKIQNNAVPKKQIRRNSFNKESKIADGSNGAQIYVGVLDNTLPVAVKQVPNDTLINKRPEKNKHIAPVIATEEDDFKYLAIPLCECNLEEPTENGYELDNKLSKVQMCYQLILGLHQLHEMDIHRDLKPRKVLLGKQVKSTK